MRMQRLGYLKRLIKRVVTMPTSSLDNLGTDLVETTLKKIRFQIDDSSASYIKARLIGNAYAAIKNQINTWLKDGGEAPFLLLELQDLYLANPKLPSQVGRLVKEDWRKYPQFGMSIGLIRPGTYSATTRAFSFLHLVPDREQQAFIEYIPDANPFFISLEQSLLLIYSFLENDGEILVPLWKKLITGSLSPFTDRDAGDLIPSIIKNVISRYKNKQIPVDLRKKLESLGKTADNIALQLNVQDYSGVTAREEASRVRIETTVDLGLLQKTNPFRYEYTFSEMGKTLANAFTGEEDSAAIGDFLHQRFFSTIAAAQGIRAEMLAAEDIIPRLQSNWKIISSSNGYAPIEEIALLAGIKALVNENKVIEIATSREALIAYQKANPYAVRFTVDRLGALAHAKFIDDTNR
jgi:hypothetical protein